MTRIKIRHKPIWHQSAACERGREILAAESPHNCLLRLKGTRGVLTIPWTAIYLWAARHEAEQVRKRKIEARKANRKARANGTANGI
jgi:hypothetical protein